jgi:hypothetical protein
MTSITTKATGVGLFVSPKTSITTEATGVGLFVLPKTPITTKATCERLFKKSFTCSFSGDRRLR